MTDGPRRLLASLSCLALAACGDAPTRLSTTAPPRGGEVASAELPGGGTDDTSTPGGEKRRADGVVFLHGTSDHEASPYKCDGAGDDFKCAAKSAVDTYWQQATLDSERTRADGSKRPYAVLGCQLAAETPWPNPSPVRNPTKKPEPGTGACVAAQITKFLDGPDGQPGTADDVKDVVIVTHSGGSNVARYVLQQHTARPEFERVHAAARGFIGIAAPNHGTFLADWMFTFGSLGSVASSLTRLFGGEGFFDDDGVAFIRTTSMASFNRDPAKLVDLSKDVAGVPSFMASGTFPDTKGDEAKVACGGSAETKGLALLHSLYMGKDDLPTFRDDCSDGFISCRSAMALANGDPSRVLFGRLDDGRVIGRTHFRAHNQSRLTCDGLDLDVRKKVQELLDGAAPSAPPTLAANDSPAREWRSVLDPLSVARAGFTRFAPAGSPSLDARDAAPATLTLRAAPLFATGSRVEVDVALDGVLDDEATTTHGWFESPSRDRRVEATFTRRPDGTLVASATLPRDASPGTWTAHVEADGRGEAGAWTRDADIALTVRRVVARFSELSARAVDGGVEVSAVVDVDEASRVGLRATLVREVARTAIALGAPQMSRDVQRGTTRITWKIAAADLADVHLRDVALVRHDDASTQAVVSEVPLAR
ncbi:MAG: hypothetical protein R3B36_21025 [Polyangiaceae bacterium]